MRFNNKVVWITGASSGIGEALALAFAQDGAHCVLSSRRIAETEAVRLRCPHPDRHRVVQLDLTAFETHDAIAKEVGPVDLLVHNGGVSQRSLVVDTSLDVTRHIMDVNFTGAVSLTRAVLPSMLARSAGQIVVISSVVGHISTPGRAVYSASKHALHGYFEALRAEVADRGVSITMVSPWYVRTRISLNALKGDGSAHSKMDQVQERGMSAERCASRILRAVAAKRPAVFIAGPERLGVLLYRIAPWLYRRLVRRYGSAAV